MLFDPFPQSSTRPPKELGGTSASVFMFVEDVDAAKKPRNLAVALRVNAILRTASSLV